MPGGRYRSAYKGSTGVPANPQAGEWLTLDRWSSAGSGFRVEHQRAVRDGVEQRFRLRRIGRVDRHQPAVPVRLVVDELGMIVDQRVAFGDGAGDRAEDVGHG